MKRSFYPRLAIDGMRKNRRMYGPYLAMGVLMAAICYILRPSRGRIRLGTFPRRRQPLHDHGGSATSCC